MAKRKVKDSNSGYISCNDYTHGVYINTANGNNYREVKNLEGDPSNEDKAFIHNGTAYVKQLKFS